MTRSVLLIISGSVAAYKTLDVIRRLRERVKERAQKTLTLLRTLPTLLRNAELALERVNSGGFKLHPETQHSMAATRQHIHCGWRVFAWSALAVFAVVYTR